MSNKSVQIVRRLLPLVPLAFGAAIVATTRSNSPPAEELTRNAVSPPTQDPVQITQATPATPHVTVDGHQIHLATGGTGSVTLTGSDGSKTHIEASGDQTKVTTTNPAESSIDKTKQNDRTDLSIDTGSSGGKGSSASQVLEFDTSTNRSSSSFATTYVFSTGPNHVALSP